MDKLGFELRQSRYLNCLSSFRGQLSVDSKDRIHRDLQCFTGLAQFISEKALLVQTCYRKSCMLLGEVSMEIFILGTAGGCPGRSCLVGAWIWFAALSSIAFCYPLVSSWVDIVGH